MTSEGTGGDRVDHSARAEALHSVLQDRFWQSRKRLFAVTEGRPLGMFGAWHHWWQSHALAALLDRRDRTGDVSSSRQAEALVEGMRRRGHRRLTNDFYDDMGWLALALLRMPGREQDVLGLLAAIRAGEDPEGGIAWAGPHPEFRNVPATGPAALVALRLGARTGDDRLVAWGLSLVHWLEGRLIVPDGTVYDGLRRRSDGTTEVDTALYSYNFGLVVGAGLAAHTVTGDPAHLKTAHLVSTASLRQFADPRTGIWRSEGVGDRALFRGILSGHLADLALATGAYDLAASVRTQADAVWRSSAGGSVGHDWSRVPDRPVDLSEHVGGLLVVEAAARLDPIPG